ncbi:MAG TPA: hypothetical protein VFQ56_06435 [Flavobacterium sp.]|nr:hypothetical protein [Flavobacterium sp.]
MIWTKQGPFGYKYSEGSAPAEFFIAVEWAVAESSVEQQGYTKYRSHFLEL